MTELAPTHRLVQLSDLHLVEEGKLLRDVMDTPSRTRDALDQALTFSPDAVILSGDIGQRNHHVHDDAAAYFGHFQDHLGIPFIAVGGNHDPINSVGTAFNPAKIASGPELCDTVHDVHGLRIIGVDTHGVGRFYGHLTAEQYDWLAQVLAKPTQHGTLWLLITRRFLRPRFPSAILGCRKPINSTMCLKPAMSARFYRDITTIKFLAHSVTYRYGFQVRCPRSEERRVGE